MVDIWLLCMMLYPFFLVILLTTMEIFDSSQIAIEAVSGKWTAKEKRGTQIISFLLKLGLPILLIIFMLVYWTVGLYNVVAPDVYTVC